MNCINHPEKVAVAACVHCGVGICPECRRISSTGRSVCSEKCADRLFEAEKALSAPIKKIGSSLRTTGWVYGIFGVAGVVGGGITMYLNGVRSGLFALIAGVVFLFVAVKNFRNARDA